jgi:hypothetical protein
VYVAKKDLTDLRDRFRISINRDHYLEVFIWKNHEALWRNIGDEKKDSAGSYISMPYKIRVGKDFEEKVFPPKYGEIHLIDGRRGSGTVAHEIQHFLIFWMLDHDLNVEDEGEDEWLSIESDNEKLCLLAGRITRLYWKAIYRRGLDAD